MPDIEATLFVSDAGDPVAPWFTELERGQGEQMQIRFGRVTDSKVEWRLLPHWRFDGIGGMTQLFRERGADVALPVLRNETRPGRWGILRLLFRHLTRARSVPPWKRLNRAWKPPMPALQAAGWRVLDAAAARRLDERAAALGVSANSLLLWALDRAARAELLAPAAREAMWMIPVNLRGPVKLGNELANHVGFLDVELPANADPARVHAAIKKELGLGMHWATWILMGWVGRLGRAALRLAVLHDLHLGPTRFGSLSNLGEWPALTENEAWVFTPPTMRILPLSTGVVTVGGRLGLAAQAHPATGATDADVQRLVDRWVEILTSV